MAKLDWVLQARHDEVRIYRSGANLKIVLCRTRQANALSRTMTEVLIDTYRRAATDRSIARIILTGEGRFFCTGMDLTTVGGDSKSGSSSSNETDEPPQFRMFSALFSAIEAAPQVTIAALNGPCYAGGVGLAFVCDVRLAVAAASATLSEVHLGLCPALISKYVVREWGHALAREAMLSGRTVPFSELCQAGAVHGPLAADAAALDALVEAYVTGLRRCAPRASTVIKHLVKVAGSDEQDGAIRTAFLQMMQPGAESSVGVPNFKAKKKTDWDGLALAQPAAKL